MTQLSKDDKPNNRVVPIMDPPPYEATDGNQPIDDRLKIVVGLDFGTTNSGISYVTSDQNSADKIEVIRQWPSGPGTTGKVPSVVAYATDNPDDDLNDIEWGFSAQGFKSYMWTKLLLGKDLRSTEIQSDALRAIYGEGFCALPEGKSAKDVVTDYLYGLYKYLIARLRRHDENTFRVTPMEFWITVPAMWTDAAKSATIEAAQAAGFGSRPMDSVHIITEPEAAALSVLMPRVGLGSVTGLENGSQNILICDCGGGTVDIVTYKVSMVKGKLEFEELLVGTGAMCGSTAIDRNFHALMVEKFGDAYKSVDSDQRGPSSNFFRQFEIAKKNFTGPSHSKRIDVWPINMNIPKSANYDKRNFTVRLQATDMLGLFDPVIDEIVTLVDSQVSAAKDKGESINQIFLVGGFGDSPYLNVKLQEWCKPRGIELRCPPSCQEAIVKGAALRGLEGLKPNKRLARRHYGYSISLPFREGIDPEAWAWTDSFYGTKYCSHRMTWFCARGDVIDDWQKKFFDLERSIYENSTDLTSTLEIWCCDQDTAPETTQHWSMRKMGSVTVNFTDDEIWKNSECKIVNDQKIYKARYRMEVDFVSERGDICFNYTMGGIAKEQAVIHFEEKYDKTG